MEHHLRASKPRQDAAAMCALEPGVGAARVSSRRLRAVTFDFWGTLVDGEITPERTAARLARLHAAITGAGYACSVEELAAARERIEARLSEAAHESYEDVGPPGRWARSEEHTTELQSRPH